MCDLDHFLKIWSYNYIIIRLKYILYSYICRKCLDIILEKIKTAPDHFEKFCTILKTGPCFIPFLEIMIMCFTVHSSETEIKEFININSLVANLNDFLNSDEKELLDPNTHGEVARTGEDSQKDYFVKISKHKNQIYIKMFMKHLASETSNTKLYQLLQGRIAIYIAIDCFNEKNCNPSVSVSVVILEYKGYLTYRKAIQ